MGLFSKVGKFLKKLNPLNLLGDMFSMDIPAPPPLPEIEDPAVIPDPDDKARKAAQRRKHAKRRQQSGRLSTIHTAPTSTVLG